MQLPWTLILCALVACDVPERRPFDPTKPHRYQVLRGDTWQSISSKRECEAEEIRAWNGLAENHRLIPGQVLWLFPDGKGAPRPGEHPAVAAARFFDPDAPPPKVKPLPRPTAAPDEEPAEDGVADAGEQAPEERAAGTAQAPRKTIDGDFGPGGTALLSLLDEVEDGPPLQAVPSVAVDANPLDSVLAGRRGGLGGGGDVDRTDVDIARPGKPEPAGPAGPTEIPKLAKAEPKSCLRADLDQEIGEYDIAGAAGLDRAAIKSGMRPVLLAVQRCLPGGGNGPHELHVQVDVGCDGLVYHSEVVKDAGLPEAITGCVSAVTDQASFAAAAGATSFLYPVVIGY